MNRSTTCRTKLTTAMADHSMALTTVPYTNNDPEPQRGHAATRSPPSGCSQSEDVQTTPHAPCMVLPAGQPGVGQLVQCLQVRKASDFHDPEHTNPFAHSGGGGLTVNLMKKLKARSSAESFLCNTTATPSGIDTTEDNALQTVSPAQASLLVPCPSHLGNREAPQTAPYVHYQARIL